MCCGKQNLKSYEAAPWFVNVIAGSTAVSFSSEEEAMKFLRQGIDNVPEKMQPIYAALRFRYENAYD